LRRGNRKRFCGELAGLKTMAWVPAESAVEELMPQLLPEELCDWTGYFDPSLPLSMPQEYLRRVQTKAAQWPDAVVAQTDPKKLKRKQGVNVSLLGCQPAPEGYSPTLQWQQQNVHQHGSHWKSQQVDSNVTRPKSKVEEGWKKFCLSESIVSRMNQTTVASVLEYLSNLFGERDFTLDLRRWLYALLACLEKPLFPEVHSLIQQLARRLLVDSKDDERVPALNLLICLVSRYFDQCDLADKLA
uniref:Gem-associated protein 2 n=1 Tax=Cebus imitator TaxID=2715852 RepID=A0A2K5RAG4_CEBIM